MKICSIFLALAIDSDTRKGQQPETLDEHNQFACLIHRPSRSPVLLGCQRDNARKALALFRSQLDHLLDLGSTERLLEVNEIQLTGTAQVGIEELRSRGQ